MRRGRVGLLLRTFIQYPTYTEKSYRETSEIDSPPSSFWTSKNHLGCRFLPDRGRFSSDKVTLYFSASPLCSLGQFACSNGPKCIPRSWLCDGARDCPDGSDETHIQCHSHLCKPLQLRFLGDLGKKKSFIGVLEKYSNKKNEI